MMSGCKGLSNNGFLVILSRNLKRRVLSQTSIIGCPQQDWKKIRL